MAFGRMPKKLKKKLVVKWALLLATEHITPSDIVHTATRIFPYHNDLLGKVTGFIHTSRIFQYYLQTTIKKEPKGVA